MALQDQVPTSVQVAQAPDPKNVDQTAIWFSQIATFIQGIQSLKEYPIMSGTAQIGTAKALKAGPAVFVQGKITVAAGTDISVIGIPVEPAIDGVLTAYGSPGFLLTKGSKTVVVKAPTGTEVVFSGWYIGSNSGKR